MGTYTNATDTTDGTGNNTVSTGSTGEIKFIDVNSQQLIGDFDVRF